MKHDEFIRFLDERLFIPNLSSNTKEKVLKEMIEPLIQSGNLMNENLIFGTLYNRETLGSTGIGKGVAIPHCRTLTVTEIYIVVGFSKKGILFDAVDKIVDLSGVSVGLFQFGMLHGIINPVN